MIARLAITHGTIVLSLAAFAWPAAGQKAPIDGGVFLISRESVVVGKEEFALHPGRRAGDGRGFTLSARAVYPPDRPTVRIASMIEFGPDSQPATGQIDVDDGERRSLLVALAGRRVTVRTVTPAGDESARQYPATDRTVIVDADLASSFVLLPRRGSATVAVIEPRTLTRVLLPLVDRGAEATAVDGQMRTLYHVTLGSGADLRHLWYDEDGRLWKVHVPATQLTAVRSEQGEP